MKNILLLILVAIGAWWYFIGGRTISEENVRAFYQQQTHAMLSRDPELLCALLDDDFTTTGTIAAAGNIGQDSADKPETCEAYRNMYQNFADLGEKMGGMLQLGYFYDIHAIDISDDKKTATVEVSYRLDVGGSLMNIRSNATEVLIRKNGKMLMLSSEGDAEVGNQ